MIELVERDFNGFFEVPFNVYPSSSPYVSPMRDDLKGLLDGAKNPLFGNGAPFTWFTAHKSGRPVGRIVTHIHPASNELHRTNRAYFGFFDCENDRNVAACLLRAAEEWARNQKCAEIAGNFSLTAMQQIGVQTGGFDAQPYTDMQCNPPYIPEFLIAEGYQAFFPSSTFELDLTGIDPESLLTPKVRSVLSSPEFDWKHISRLHIGQRLEETRRILNDGFSANPMFVALTEDEFRFHAKQMMWIVDPRITILVQHQGRPVGVIVCIPDLNPFIRSTRSRVSIVTPIRFIQYRLNRTRAVIVFYSVCRDLQGRGLNAAMLYRLIVSLRRFGYERLGVTWIGDENGASLRQMQHIGATRLHRLHLFRKEIS